MRKHLLVSAALALGLLANAAHATSQAIINLTGSNSTIAQASNTGWSLSNTGSLANGFASWTVNAAEAASGPPMVILGGFLSVNNTGSAGATIGNIVVNLQRRSGNSWATVSSDIADADLGDQATTANVCRGASSEGKSSFSTNAASLPMQFSDANNNSIFALSPEITVAPGTALNMLVNAKFDNSLLLIPKGELVRFEVIVSFGNAGGKGANDCTSIDISGDNIISADEMNVRSVPVRFTLAVPTNMQDNASVTLTDLASNLALTGTASYSSFSTTVGAGSGTEMISGSVTRTATTSQVNGGANGGTITDCASIDNNDSTFSLVGPINSATALPSYTYTFVAFPGVHQIACNTVTISPPSSFVFAANEFYTFTQDEWPTEVAQFLISEFPTVYPSGVTIGRSTGFTDTFTTAQNVLVLLPAAGTPAALNANLINPVTTSAGAFAGEVLALQINVDFNDAGVMGGTSLPAHFGDLYVVNTGNPAFDGQTVRHILLASNHLLAGLPTVAFTIPSTYNLLIQLNQAFDNGVPSAFAMTNLSLSP
jgi:hypothetical protein